MTRKGRFFSNHKGTKALRLKERKNFVTLRLRVFVVNFEGCLDSGTPFLQRVVHLFMIHRTKFQFMLTWSSNHKVTKARHQPWRAVPGRLKREKLCGFASFSLRGEF